jgi:hypothetical protein
LNINPGMRFFNDQRLIKWWLRDLTNSLEESAGGDIPPISPSCWEVLINVGQTSLAPAERLQRRKSRVISLRSCRRVLPLGQDTFCRLFCKMIWPRAQEQMAKSVFEKLQTRSALGLLFSKLFQCAWGYGGIHRSVTSHAHRWGPFVGYSFLHSTHPFMNTCIWSQTHTQENGFVGVLVPQFMAFLIVPCVWTNLHQTGQLISFNCWWGGVQRNHHCTVALEIPSAEMDCCTWLHVEA